MARTSALRRSSFRRPALPQPPARSRVFGIRRPSQQGVSFTLSRPQFKGAPFQRLPAPTGSPPYHVALQDVIAPEVIKAIRNSGRMVLHIVGDTGGVKDPVPQQLVANNMEEDFQGGVKSSADNPAFFYHLGDVIYFNGEATEYFPQFYQPYEHYPAPVFAIPGNHDALPIDPSVPSLEAFVTNFCSSQPVITPDAGEAARQAMTEPNVYWTLETPFATIVGLYTNVPEHGQVDDTQKAWLASELKSAPGNKALIVAMHHPIYSADSHHGGSGYMGGVLDDAVKASKRRPDIVFGAHVHNYQRFTRALGKAEIPYIVAGAGGYWHLHYVAEVNGQPMMTPAPGPEPGVTLENYVDDRHGFLRLEITAKTITGKYYVVPRPQEPWRGGPKLADSFTLDWTKNQLQ